MKNSFPSLRAGLRPLLLAALTLISQHAGAQPKELIKPVNLELVGGYRVPWYHGGRNQFANGASTGFPYGGLAVHTFENGETVVWHETGTIHSQVLESKTSKAMGSAKDSYANWPVLGEAASADSVWTKQELFGNRGEGGGYTVIQGLAFDAVEQRLWVSMRSTYATGPDPAQWLAAVDYPSKQVNPVTPDLSSLNAQFYGGGLGIIPEAFADEHLGGRRLGFISGGYESGQRASAGPTLAAIGAKPSENPNPIELMYYLQTGQVGATPFAQGSVNVAESFPDYTSDQSWTYPVTNGVGYWPASSIRGNGAWVDVPGLEGVLYMAARGAGDQRYAAQTEGGGAPLKNSLYVYDPQAFVEIAAAERDPMGVPKEFYDYYEWDSNVNGGIPLIARGMSYDAGSGLLWVLYPQAWRGDVELHPIVAAYRIVGDASVPEPSAALSAGMLSLAVVCRLATRPRADIQAASTGPSPE